MAKKRHLIRSSIKSFFESHTDPAKHDELKATKQDMEEKKLEILKIVQNDEQKDGSKRGSLAELIEDFHKQYESLYAHYDHLTGELKNKVHKHRHGKGNSSSSSDSESDSDSDKSPNENGSKNGELEDEMLKATDGLQQELEEAKLEVTLLKNKLEVVSNEKDTLESAYGAMILELENTEITVENLKVETETLKYEKSVLQTEKEGLNSKLEDSVKTEVDLKQQIVELMKVVQEKEEENIIMQTRLEEGENESTSKFSAFLMEISSLKLELEAVQAIKSELEVETEKTKQEYSESLNGLEFENAELKNKLEKLTHEFTIISESKDESVAELEGVIEELKRDVEVAEDEYNTALDKTRTIEVQLRMANQKLRVTEQLLTEKEADFLIVEKRYQEESKQLEDKISRLSVEIEANIAAYHEMITSISDNLNNSAAGMESVNKKFEEDNEKFVSRIYSMSEEIQILKNCMAGKNAERELLEKQLKTLTEQLQNEREHGILVKQNVSKLEVEAEELNLLLKKQNEQVRLLEDEKREAIRQLCLWNDDVQSRYNELKNMVAKSSLQRR